MVCLDLFVEDLKKMPAPEIAVNYYTGGDLYLFGKLFHLYALIVGLLTGKTRFSHSPTSTSQMNFKLPEFQILEGPR